MPGTAVFGLVAGLLNLVAFVPFIYSIFSAGKRPNRATWIIWAVLNWILLFQYAQTGATETWWVTVGLVIGSTPLALLALRWGEGGWTPFDLTCIAAAALSIVLWFYLGSPETGLVMTLAVDGFGVAAAIRHAYRKPEEESALAWGLFFFGDALNVLAVTDWTLQGFGIWIYPVVMALYTAPIFVLTLRKKGPPG
ncbi:hypothetical protein A2763_01610 [Candidatus Kaiserbacteria bacterium RIFCSPHIGHO2_01_FULL_54_36]|uniref:Uncharacterized protein n=1 Tax=Candidatus Kaiserbacteria bacterium RIFCSPHIGHO2_01_FULL_54_36 TaxID=1798482 RepID=A0A1F6CKV6_9BACT|nr:MAG: hypothetical protein A2763_01610 [Candidatus Kaiserbacteria bacterium RIFCSPHIGHO2_01_FULL_54_36]OGG75473.1 MAG: hypothetical protein A3A41_01210 [Candidatus Kaiserbacteria bacterium RIFCSPLOWO2_01_FULL_54_22]